GGGGGVGGFLWFARLRAGGRRARFEELGFGGVEVTAVPGGPVQRAGQPGAAVQLRRGGRIAPTLAPRARGGGAPPGPVRRPPASGPAWARGTAVPHARPPRRPPPPA